MLLLMMENLCKHVNKLNTLPNVLKNRHAVLAFQSIALQKIVLILQIY